MIKKFIDGEYGLGVTFWAGFISPFGFIRMVEPIFMDFLVHFFASPNKQILDTLQDAKMAFVILSWIWIIPASIAVWNAGKSSTKISMILTMVVVSLYWTLIILGFIELFWGNSIVVDFLTQPVKEIILTPRL